jgi:hypothetical protein
MRIASLYVQDEWAAPLQLQVLCDGLLHFQLMCMSGAGVDRVTAFGALAPQRSSTLLRA